ncbi:MAG TPA: CsbD family protein [Myxococcaceae bacterium]|nr:CsbD family protein [Myxococcaceae bacterium]
MAGLTDKLKGKIKEVAGAATDDPSTENEGKLDQAKGSLKNASENLKDRAKEALGGAADKMKEAAERAERKTSRDPDDA